MTEWECQRCELTIELNMGHVPEGECPVCQVKDWKNVTEARREVDEDA